MEDNEELEDYEMIEQITKPKKEVKKEEVTKAITNKETTREEPRFVPVPRAVSTETMLNEIYDELQLIKQILTEK